MTYALLSTRGQRHWLFFHPRCQPLFPEATNLHQDAISVPFARQPHQRTSHNRVKPSGRLPRSLNSSSGIATETRSSLRHHFFLGDGGTGGWLFRDLPAFYCGPIKECPQALEDDRNDAATAVVLGRVVQNQRKKNSPGARIKILANIVASLFRPEPDRSIAHRWTSAQYRLTFVGGSVRAPPNRFLPPPPLLGRQVAGHRPFVTRCSVGVSFRGDARCPAQTLPGEDQPAESVHGFLGSAARIRPRSPTGRGGHEHKDREKGHFFEIDFILILRCFIKITRLQRLKLKSKLFSLAQILQNEANC